MAEKPERPAQTVQHEGDANEEIVERNERLGENTDGHKEQRSAASNHSRSQYETSRSHENEANCTTPPRSPEIHAATRTFKCWHDFGQGSEVEGFIYEPEQPSAPGPQLFGPEDADCTSWASPSNPRCPASFGDNGTTATAGAFGQLVQFSDYLGAGNSGIFCASHRATMKPYLVTERARGLRAFAMESFEKAQVLAWREIGFGLKFVNLELIGHATPKLKWFHNRWPRYEYKEGCFKGMEDVALTIQFVVRNRTVFQQCILENRGDTDVDLELAFCKGMGIWDLDHVTDDYGFNRSFPNGQNAGPGPGGFGWVQVNRFHEELLGARRDSQCSSREEKSIRSQGNRNKNDEPHGVAVVVSMAVDGKIIRFSPEHFPHSFTHTLKAKSRSQKLEIVTAYKLVLLANPFSDWKAFVIPLKGTNPSRILREAKAVSLFRTSITKIGTKEDVESSHDNHDSEILRDGEKRGEADILNISREGVAPVGGQTQSDSSPAVDHEPTPEKTSPIIEHIEFAVRRNLEHILGVCAIPVTVRVPEEDAKEEIWEKLRGVQPIALSCGDMSGNRIYSSSSFFAFQFLAEVAKRLIRLPQPERNDIQVQTLLSRIRKVCLGHLKWLYAAEKAGRDEQFRSLYWVTGEAVTRPESSDTWVPHEHVRNTAFQILKARIFADTFNADEDGGSSIAGEMISRWGRGWVQWLERSDRRESLTWYHKEDEGLKVFRLDDHVWIWRALKVMEDERSGAWESLYVKAQRDDRSSSTGSEAGSQALSADEMLRRSRKFSSQTVQREVLRKFTTENEILRKKMVALTRSPRGTRFLIHARDTAILYGQDVGFFPGNTSFEEMWKNTIEAQRFHDHNQEARWNNALRYALSIMLGIRGHQINEKKPGQMVWTATEVLLQSSSENGLFPGKLDIMTKGPLEDVFHEEADADSYYEAGFEIPYVLLIYAKEIGALVEHSAEPVFEKSPGDVNSRQNPTKEHPKSPEAMPARHTSNPQVQVGQREEDKQLRKLLARLSDVLSALPHLPNSISASDREGAGELVVDGRLALKKTIPSSNIIDSHSIFEIEDEWLFNYPEFFSSEDDENASMDTALDLLKDCKMTWPSSINFAEMRRKYSSHKDENIDEEIHSKASSDCSPADSVESFKNLGEPGDSGLVVLDVPSRKRLQEKGTRLPTDHIDVHAGSFEHIWGNISRPRSVAKAKKRMIYWSRRGTDPGLEAALLCFAVSKGDEREAIVEFFERHFQHENFLFDHCNLAYNTWETEVHLSFFILEDVPEPVLPGNTARHVEKLPGIHGKHVSRRSIGFRLHGDAFDRYWTLHWFTDMGLTLLRADTDVFGHILLANERSTVMYQRKVAEIRYFSGMLGFAKSNTQQILGEVKSELGIKSGAFSWSTPSMDKYSSWSTLWEGFAPLIQALAEDLTSIQDMISQWEAREGGRGQDRPRWTHSDERRFRAAIMKSQRVLNWRKRGIQNLLNDVESLQELCTARLANAREELSFRSSQNIASFTYVTIVFLPLGFAASVFSMNGYPAAGWVASMVVIAVVTLAITAIALANAKLLLVVAGQFSKDVLRFTETVFRSSLIGQQQQRQSSERAQASLAPKKPDYGDQKSGDPLQSHATRHVLFWMAYLLIELPARRVALACRALPASLMRSLALPRPDSEPPSAFDSTGGSSGPSAAAVGQKIIRVAGGILILPLLLISWTIQILFYNLLDILAFLGRLTRKTFYALVAPGDANGAATDTKMVTWLIDPPSSLRPVRKFMRSDEKGEKPSLQAAVPGAGDRSDSGSLEKV